jgi:CHAD domain-containing protein
VTGPASPSDEARTPTAGGFVAASLRELDRAVRETAPRVLRGEGTSEAIDEDAVHDLRVAIRRLRTLLKMSRGLVGRWHADVVRSAFRAVMRATGDLRDEEVLEETLGAVAEGPELKGWLDARRAREAELRRAVVERIRRGDLERAHRLLDALLAFPVDPRCDVELGRFARRILARARREVARKQEADVEDVTGMHELRIACKELRYSIELLAEALTDPHEAAPGESSRRGLPAGPREELERATLLQKRLGELHDVDVAIEVVRDAKALSRRAREQAGTALEALRERRAAKYLRALDPPGGGPDPAAGGHAETSS